MSQLILRLKREFKLVCFETRLFRRIFAFLEADTTHERNRFRRTSTYF